METTKAGPNRRRSRRETQKNPNLLVDAKRNKKVGFKVGGTEEEKGYKKDSFGVGESNIMSSIPLIPPFYIDFNKRGFTYIYHCKSPNIIFIII